MKRIIVFFAVLMTIAESATAQQSYIDSLKRVIAVSQNDTLVLVTAGKIANVYAEINPDSSAHYASKMLVLARKLDLKLEEAAALDVMGYALLNIGNYPRSLQALLQSIAIVENPDCEKNLLPSRFPTIDEFSLRTPPPHMQRLTRLSRSQQDAAVLYGNSGNYAKAFQYYSKCIPLAEETNNMPLLTITYITLGRTYMAMKKPDSSLFCLQKAYAYATNSGYNKYIGSILLNIGRVYMAKGDRELAKQYFVKALKASSKYEYFRGVVASSLVLADICLQTGRRDSSLFHIQHGLSVAKFLSSQDLYLRLYAALADFYRNVNSDSTVKYQGLIIKINNELNNSRQIQQFQNIDFDEQLRQQEILTAKKDYQDRQQKYMLLGGLALFLFLVIVLWRNNLRRQRTNIILEAQKKEIESTLTDLKSTQAQLIQSEKMASLGELTAGIAHEIQNPLNFVNNFSEVNKELLGEMNEKIEAGNVDEAIVIARNIIENEDKITFHGKRADAIVKGMLQHSRNSSGVKEPTNINALADEYLRLAYHGLRAKNKSFNAAMRTDFDKSIGNINVIPQDFGRVILNLITNAFYAASEKKGKPDEVYEPTVTVSTRKTNKQIEIRVKDNGNGIPKHVLDKIFQPFFTTKPTGQGTGLGLSLSYEIVKAHGGDLRVTTREGEFAEFIITLPIG